MHRSKGEKVFNVFNICLLILLSMLCVLPYLHVLAISLSSKTAAATGTVLFWPLEPTLKSYAFLTAKSQFMAAFVRSLQRVLLGTTVNICMITLTAYPLSKDNSKLMFRTVYAWIIVITMFVSGGMIPTYLIVRQTGLIDTLWALVLPGAVSAYSVTILLNFFRGLPKELDESAFIDGAGHLTLLLKIYVPLSLPCLMTVMLFSIVGHWNAWFDGMIYTNKPAYWPLQTFLQNALIQDLTDFTRTVDAAFMKSISQRTVRAAQVLIASIPVLIAYPFMQRHFVKGMILGSMKG